MTVGSRKMDLVLASCFIFPLFLSKSCFADDTISQGQSIRFGQTIISPDESFALGFFSPSSSTNHYLGIWFYKLPVQTIVWVANRENPLTDSSGVLKLNDDGNLVVLDGNGTTIWSSNVSVSAINSTAQLLDSGNLVLIESKTSGKFFWESFNYPSDTFLPSMKFGLNLRTGENQLLKPWRNPKDPSTGNFSLGFDPRGLAQIVIWQGSEIYWRSGLWNGQGFIGVPEMSSFYLYNFNVITDVEQGRLYCTYTDTNKSQFSRFLVHPSGQLQRLYWVPDYNQWVNVWSQPKNQCELYNFCGINGSCNRNSFPVCSCLFGFEPKSPKDWAMGNWSGGCERRTRLQCEKNSSGSLNGKGDGLFKLPGMKLPDSSNWLAVDKTDVCRDNCLKNCSCVAVSYEAGLGCMYWSDDLVDLQIFPKGGQDLYIRLAYSEIDTYLSDNGGKKKRILVIIIVLVILGTIILVILAYFMCRFISKQRARWKCKRHGHKLVALELGGEVEAFTDNLDTNKIKESVRKGKDLESPLFDLYTILAATDNFSTANKLGEGGFGPVYKGKLPEGQEIAVKRLSRGSGQGLVEFENEVVLIAKLQHRNLVRLLGYCIQGEEKLLIYEYMPHKSLDAFLFDRTKREQLDWRKRIHIIEGIARGLLYLHRDSRLTIIHRDLKASNILLDGEMNPKISDFGMARIFRDNQEQGNTNRVVGTYGYMAPEYAMEGLFSEKSDIYSFGVLLLEVMSGKKNTSFYSYGQSLNLLGYAWQLWKDDKELDLMDHSLSGSFPEREASRCINVGLLCVQECAEDRPTISSVVFMLGNEATTLPSPKQPAFSVGRSARETTISSIGSYSINDLTISIVEGR